MMNKQKHKNISNQEYDNIKLKLDKIDVGEAKLNPTKFEKTFQVIHAVGPNGIILGEEEYWKKLEKTFESISKVLDTIKLNSDYEIRLPMISSDIYKPTQYKDEDFYPLYFQKITQYINKYLKKYDGHIVLGVFKNKEKNYFKNFKNLNRFKYSN